MPSPKAVCSISFVRDTLFPYALSVLPAFLRDNWNKASFEPFRDAFPEHARDTPEHLESYVRDLTSQDLKVACLKQLQGLLWRTGYETGSIKAPIYNDVLPAIQRWVDDGRKALIYSSGSVDAQKLLFKYTDTPLGDMTPLLSGYYDTVNAGMKQDSASYASISEKEGIKPSEWLFLSDNVKEVEAARQAGMDSIVLVRPGNLPLTEEEKEKYRVTESFEDLLCTVG
ncbi:acireductone synthase-like protein [Trichophaea hybrida]|nr:acireductone synthase-like protein [Trichophaea hybrida]